LTPVFYNWSKWSTVKPVPLLGDENTPIDQVVKFYKFWVNFKSWRDFSFMDEFDTEEAESREEKRWMEKQNSKLRQKEKNTESATILKLVEMAEKFDVRLIKKREEHMIQKMILMTQFQQ